MRRFCLSFILLAFISLAFSCPVQAQTTNKDPAAHLIEYGGYLLSQDGRIIRSHDIDTSFIPASTVKLVTALAALEILGAEHRFTTRFYQDQSDNLYIQGSGDPSLISEEISHITQRLHQMGVRQINDLILDDSAFALKASTPGSENSHNPYDAPNNALAVNYNSLPLIVDNNGSVRSGEPQSPTLNLSRKIGRHLKSGWHRVNVEAYPGSGEITNTLRYSGELFSALLHRQGIVTHGAIRPGAVSSEAKLLYSHQSTRTVRDLVRDMLKYSNNFIANQLFLSCGAKEQGGAATWHKGRLTIRNFLTNRLNLSPGELHVVEGSGLSRENRSTPRAMIRVLEHFYPHKSLLTNKKDVSLKSGSLNGVYCYAGYLPLDGQAQPFAILLNQKKNTRDYILRIIRP
ncbi:MAG: D-alanyl-D-alanine carboxypeptidase [Desulfobulbaceae bacterium]|uniref:D-alanyl-D-alanine carboxypeptidase n=1 Tax=Candidatus Desulfatifera sulfidica TaxID=2841691 RepID=A0A8J6NA30_9BACT|nr:D-alanyl-D-alanine carboxypeptidase [Candidatus Desulfatifera sulfidica]